MASHCSDLWKQEHSSRDLVCEQVLTEVTGHIGEERKEKDQACTSVQHGASDHDPVTEVTGQIREERKWKRKRYTACFSDIFSDSSDGVDSNDSIDSSGTFEGTAILALQTIVIVLLTG